MCVEGSEGVCAQLRVKGNTVECPSGAVVLDGRDSDVEMRLPLCEDMPYDLVGSNNVETGIDDVSIIP